MNRRKFLDTTVGLGLVAAARRLATPAIASAKLFRGPSLLANKSFEVAGISPSHWLMPQRVVVLEPRSKWGYATPSLWPEMQLIDEAIMRHYQRGRRFSRNKLGLILQMTQTMAGYYSKPTKLSMRWAESGAKREELSTCGMYGGFALFHQFQGEDQLSVDNAKSRVDWWLFLIPQGIDYLSLDEQPVYAILSHVFLGPWRPCTRLKTYCQAESVINMAAQGHVSGEKWDATDIANMEPVVAAQFMNERILDVVAA